jgi:hypothetical protein
LRYTLNYRTDSPADERNVSSTFSVPRGRLWVGVGITPHAEAFIRLGSTPTGEIKLERAFADFVFWKLRVRFGRFFLSMRIPDDFSVHFLQSVDFSSTDNVFDPGSAQGAQVHLAHDWLRATLSITDGLRTGFSEILNPFKADVAVTGRVELRALGDWGQFADTVSWLPGRPALKVVLAAHYQTGGATGKSTDADLVYLTGGLHAELWRFSLVLDGTWLYLEYLDETQPQGASFWQLGLVAQAGALIVEHLELWARFDAVFSDGVVRPALATMRPGTTDFRTVSGGVNFYLLPPTHRVKLQLDFQYMFDPQSTSLVPAWLANGVLATDTGQQWALRAQTVVSF